jgi:hypothetical protein
MAIERSRPGKLPPFDVHRLTQEVEGTGIHAGEETVIERPDAVGAEWATPVPRHAQLPEDLARELSQPVAREPADRPADC